MEQDLVTRLRIRAQIRRQIPSRKSVQEGKADRLSDLLEEAADEISLLKDEVKLRKTIGRNLWLALALLVTLLLFSNAV